MNPQDLACAPTNRLRKYRCKNCGGLLTQVYNKATDKYKVVCGENRCKPLEIIDATALSIRNLQSELDARDVMKNYPELFPQEVKEFSRKLFPEE